MTTIDRLRALLRDAPSLSAVADKAGCHIRTLYRVRDTDMDVTTRLADRITEAVKKCRPRRKTRA